ncbi:MAG: hypothetical protein IJL70_00450 [Treponema sp.]|nr:hypothetical protein [Treponema sp.]
MKKKAILYTPNFEKLATLAQSLVHENWEIISAGQTADFLKAQNIAVTINRALEDTMIPNDNYVKILNMILGNGRAIQSSHSTSEAFIDLVCVSINPAFKKLNDFLEIDKSENCIDFNTIDLIRAGAKNYNNVIILTDPADYDEAIIQIKTDSVSTKFRLYLAGKALNLSSAYDATCSASILSQSEGIRYPNYYMLPFKRTAHLRHGMNEHQSSYIYSINDQIGALSGIKKIQGKELNFNLLENCFSAWKCTSLFLKIIKNPFTVESWDCNNYPFTTQFTPAAGSVFSIAIKNTNPIGAALGSNLVESFKKCLSCDPACFEGATLGCSSVVDREAAEEIIKADFRAIIAPDFSREAKEIFSQKKDMRLLIASKPISDYYEARTVDGGLLVQQPDWTIFKKWKVVTQNRPSQIQADSMAFGMMLAMIAKSDAALVLNDFAAVGISTGNTSRNRAIQYALNNASEYFKNNVNSGDRNAEILVSDSVIHFDEYTKSLADIGVKAIIQTGGANNDADFINFCNEHGISMVFTGIQHLSI